MSTIKSFQVGLSPNGNSGNLRSGNAIMGQITLELSKECQIDSLIVKLKGKAEVKWSLAVPTVTYHSKEKYFSVKQSIIKEGQGNNIVGQGFHVYPFPFQIPAHLVGSLPSSFHGKSGNILYTLEAHLKTSRGIGRKAVAEFTLLHKRNPDPMLMSPQQGNIGKKMKLFNSGGVDMDVNIEKTGFHQGEGIKVVASIQNQSSSEVRPKYCLDKKCSYFAKGKWKVETEEILKVWGELLPLHANRTVTKIITVPPTTPASILNCSIIKVEYRLRVYLDVKYALDPEIKFPIVILPALGRPEEVQLPAYPADGFEAFPNSSVPGGTSFLQNPTAFDASAQPPPYGSWLDPSLTDFD
uniref:Arrestin C-terminal-like domain-containing protein n=2 Tax=Amphiprion ocellaris TaxID=80972 RepID=A0A3Q1ALZ7_AMPOC